LAKSLSAQRNVDIVPGIPNHAVALTAEIAVARCSFLTKFEHTRGVNVGLIPPIPLLHFAPEGAIFLNAGQMPHFFSTLPKVA
jgi:hypothetical protein